MNIIVFQTAKINYSYSFYFILFKCCSGIYIIFNIFLIGYIFIGNNIEIPRNAFDGIFGAGFGNHTNIFLLWKQLYHILLVH